MKKIISILLIIAMFVCLLTGCSKNDPKELPNVWYAQVDIADNVNVLLEAMLGTSAYQVKDLNVTLELNLKNDGLYLLEANSRSVSLAFGSMMLQIEEILTQTIEGSMSDEEVILSAEEYLNMSGTTMEETMEELAIALEEAGLVDEIVFSTTSQSSWFADEQKLTFGATEFSYKLKGDELTISGGNGDDPALLALPSPLTFSKTAPVIE